AARAAVASFVRATLPEPCHPRPTGPRHGCAVQQGRNTDRGRDPVAAEVAGGPRDPLAPRPDPPPRLPLLRPGSSRDLRRRVRPPLRGASPPREAVPRPGDARLAHAACGRRAEERLRYRPSRGADVEPRR